MFDRSLAFLLECFSLRGTLKLVSFYGTTKEAAEKLGILGEIRGKRPLRLNPALILLALDRKSVV